MRRGSSVSGVLLFVLVLVGVVGFWSVAGAQSSGGADLSQVEAVITDSTAKAKEIGAGIILFLSALLAIVIVVMLYKRVGGSS